MHPLDARPAPEAAHHCTSTRPLQSPASTRPGDGQDLQPWTAGRCHRLLRQLQSRLAGLRKLAVEAQALPPQKPKRQRSVDSLPPASKRIRLTYGRRRSAPAAAPEPGSAKTPPRPIRTLGAIKLDKSSPVAGLVDIPTPVWRKIREQPETPLRAQANPLPQWKHDVPEAASSDLLVEMRSLRHAVTDKRYRICEAILGWLNGLLRSTMSEAGQPHRNSLLGMCLRKIPVCVANIEAYERQVAKDQGRRSMWDASHVSFELYGQLEALGSSGSGWRPLKLAVRSHAMSLLSEAISEGLFEPAYVALLTRLCLHLHCTDEASRLAGSVEMTLPVPRSMRSSLTESKQLLPLREILESAKGKEGPREALTCVSTLVRRGLLPVSWLSARSFESVWALNLEVMTASNSGTSVAVFTSTCLPRLASCDRGKPATRPGSAEQTLLSVAAGVVAAASAVATAPGLGRENRRKRAWRRMIYVLDLCLADVRRPRPRQQSRLDDGLFIFGLARHLAVVDAPFADVVFKRQAETELKEWVQRAGGDARFQVHYRQAITLLCSLAQHRSKSYAVPCRDSVTEVCASLDRLGFGHCLRVDVAFLLAQRTKDLRDLAFAESLSSPERPPTFSTIFSGWRWEEGISEWVLPSQESDDASRYQGRHRKTRRSKLTEQGGGRRESPDVTICSGGRNAAWALQGATSRRGRPKACPSATIRVRPASRNLLGLLPAEDDWDDLV